MQQIGTCVVYKQHGCYPTASCTKCAWGTSAVYEDELARAVAAHSATHEDRGTVTLKTTIDGVPISESPLTNLKGN